MMSGSLNLAAMLNKQLNPTSTALLILCFSATLAQNNQLRSGELAGRYKYL